MGVGVEAPRKVGMEQMLREGGREETERRRGEGREGEKRGEERERGERERERRERERERERRERERERECFIICTVETKTTGPPLFAAADDVELNVPGCQVDIIIRDKL